MGRVRTRDNNVMGIIANEKKTWTTNPPKKDEIELEVSGLIGPVIIKQWP